MGLPPPSTELSARLHACAAACTGPAVLRVQLGEGLELIRLRPFGRERWGVPLRLASVAPSGLDLELAVAKHCSRGHWERGAAARGVDELLWVDPLGEVLETHQGNLFAEVDGALVTPPLDGRILAGVTRGNLLRAAGKLGLPTVVRPLRLEEAAALWVSSSLKGLAPVTELDGEAWPVGRLGARLLRALEDEERAPSP